ncbi:hypothetical protein Tco_0393323 [Tanacetum coccineum]
MGTPIQIMPPRTRTRSVGRPTTESLGGERVNELVEVEGVEDLGKVMMSVTRGMTKSTSKQGFLSAIYEGKTHEDLHTCIFTCFLSQEEPKRISKALSDPAWVEAMQEELLQFKLQKVWILVDLPKGKRAIGTKWIFIEALKSFGGSGYA